MPLHHTLSTCTSLYYCKAFLHKSCSAYLAGFGDTPSLSLENCCIDECCTRKLWLTLHVKFLLEKNMYQGLHCLIMLSYHQSICFWLTCISGKYWSRSTTDQRGPLTPSAKTLTAAAHTQQLRSTYCMLQSLAHVHIMLPGWLRMLGNQDVVQ